MFNTKLLNHSDAINLWQVWQKTAQAYPNIVALYDPHAEPEVKITYQELADLIASFGAGLRSIGIQNGDMVALIADNSPRWMVADQGIMSIGAANATRSSQAERTELLYILEHSDSIALVVENLATLKKLQPELQSLPIRQVILLSDEDPPTGMYNFEQIIDRGENSEHDQYRRELGNAQITRNTLATLIYTSGTSGKPKGVMLTHGNLLHQVNFAVTVVQIQPGERILSILPTWHSYERSFEYFTLSQGCTQIYSNLRSIKKDLKQYKPHYMVAVPRLWESIYEGVQKQFRDQSTVKQRLVKFLLSTSQSYIKARRLVHGLDLEQLNPNQLQRLWAGVQMVSLWGIHKLGDKLVYQKVREGTGGMFKFIVSGGGSIAEHIEDFYEIVGIEILGGYGLTETSPITHVRRPDRNLRYADGQPLPRTETRIVDLESRADLPTGQRGLVLIRGPQVMRGYYKNPEATAKSIDPEGWFETGDLGWVSEQGDLIITGRAKDTIVLSNGENIEPQALENACSRSPYVDQIIVVGQDQKQLGALIVPNLSALETAQLIPPNSELSQVLNELNSAKVQTLYREELNREVKNRPGYSSNDRIGLFAFLPEPFSIANGMMTQTFKVRRNVVTERYRDIIDKMFT